MLTGNKIHDEVRAGRITLDPFDPSQIGPNSYDVRIGEHLSVVGFNSSLGEDDAIDLSEPSVTRVCLDKGGRFVLYPGRAYLAHTIEVIGSDHYVPIYHGRSSAARHGLMTHYAGLGDLGWRGQLVLELVNLTGYPMILPIGVRVGQISFHRVDGDVTLYSSTYQNQRGIKSAKGLT